MSTDKNGRSHADVGGETVGCNGVLYEPGQFLPESEEQKVAKLKAEYEANKVAQRAATKPSRVLMTLEKAESLGVSHGKSWKYSWKKDCNSALKWNLEPTGFPEWDKKEVCYGYPKTWEEFDSI